MRLHHLKAQIQASTIQQKYLEAPTIENVMLCFHKSKILGDRVCRLLALPPLLDSSEVGKT